MKIVNKNVYCVIIQYVPCYRDISIVIIPRNI